MTKKMKFNPFEWIKGQVNQDQTTTGMKKSHYVIIILGIGVAFMIGTDFFGTNTNDAAIVTSSDPPKESTVETFGKESSDPKSITDYEVQYENQLKEALEEIAGVSEVTVEVNVDATELKVYEKNTTTQKQATTETDTQGGEREIQEQSESDTIVIIRDGEKEIPVILETKKPPIRGVLVVAKGADNIQVKTWIVEAVSRFLDVPTHRVSVMPKK
ncbi:stage III sporulation protein AG [Bacillus coahuilensis]|nr:stage III sporulation protein AG [Bacillus coahuilensis]